MTCGSERSGMASSGTRRMTSTEPTNASTDRITTSARCVAHHSISRAIIARSMPVCGARGGADGVGSTEAGDGGLQAALGVDQERGTRHHGVALGETLEHGDLVAVAGPGPHAPGLEVA